MNDVSAAIDDERLGDDSSVLLRPLRKLLADGKPPGPVRLISIQFGGAVSRPIGALFSGESCICFWPAYPIGTDMARELDHITLELSSGRSHATWVNANNKRRRQKGKGGPWQLYPFDDSAFAWWFPLLIRWDTIEGQEKKIRRKLESPNEKERQRRLREIAEFQRRMEEPIIVPLHPVQTTAPDYVLFQAYVLVDPDKPDDFLETMFPSDYAIGAVKGWKPSDEFAFQAVKITFGEHKFAFAVACPPGELQPAVWLGLPKKKIPALRKSMKLAG